MNGLKFFSRIGNKWKWSTCVLGVVVILIAVIYIYRYEPFRSDFEITDELGGNIFPVTILSTATTDANLIVPADTGYIGNSKSCIAVRIKSTYNNSKLRIEVDETPFFSRSVSEFILPEAGKEYTVFPDIVWDYNALRENEQAVPVSVSIHVELNKRELGSSVHTFSVRSINECLLGYIDSRLKFHDTGEFFAAYVNEDNPKIDQILREALNTRIVNRFGGIRVKAKTLSTSRCMLCGMFCRKETSNTVPSVTVACHRMWCLPSVFVRSMMLCSRLRLIVWTAVYCLLRC